MEAIIFCGVQASGKSTFYLKHFYHTHVRISMDLLRTRNRERMFMELCLKTGQRFTIDNTNPTIEERNSYIKPALQAGFSTIGYFFESSLSEALRRNALRNGKARIPDKGLGGTYKRLQVPTLDEGFTSLYKVKLGLLGEYQVEEVKPSL